MSESVVMVIEKDTEEVLIHIGRQNQVLDGSGVLQNSEIDLIATWKGLLQLTPTQTIPQFWATQIKPVSG